MDRPRDLSHLISRDEGRGNPRIGLIVLATDNATERDFEAMRPHEDVLILTTRVQNINPCTIENLRTMGPKLADALATLVPDSPLDVIAYSCTSGTVAIGDETVTQAIHSRRPGLPVITPITAALAAFDEMGAKRIAVLTPYLEDVTTAICGYLENPGGLEVVSAAGLNMEDDSDMARVTPAAIIEAARAADHPDADALFISCTAIRAVETIDQLEHELGKPVVTSIQAMYWAALRAGECADQVTGFGRLLADH